MTKIWRSILKLFIIIISLFIYLLFTTTKLQKNLNNKKLSNKFDTTTNTLESVDSVQTIIGYSLNYLWDKDMKSMKMCDNFSVIVGDNITATNNKLARPFILSAYYDNRQNPFHYIRIIGLFHPNTTNYYCQVEFKDRERVYKVSSKTTMSKIWFDHWDKSDQTDNNNVIPFVINCPVSHDHLFRIPSKIYLTNEPCSTSNESLSTQIILPSFSPLKHNFVICVKPLTYQTTLSKQIIVWIELNRLFGANKIYFYVNKLTRQDSKIIKQYEADGFAEMIKFNHLKTSNIWLKRKYEILAYNDCLYRNLYRSKFILPLDLDEILLPNIGKNWYDVFKFTFSNGQYLKNNDWPSEINNYSSFSIKNFYFFNFKKEQLPFISYTNNSVNFEYLVNNFNNTYDIFSRSIRSLKASPGSDSVKSFILVLNTLSIFNHFTFQVLGNVKQQFVFPINKIQLNHYRTNCDNQLIDDCHNYFLKYLTVDNSLDKFLSKVHNKIVERFNTLIV